MGAIEAAAGMAAALVADAEIVLSPPLLVARNQSESGAKPTTSHTSSQQPATRTRGKVCHLLDWATAGHLRPQHP